MSATRRTSRPRTVHVSGYRIIPCRPRAGLFKSHPGTRRCRRTVRRLCARLVESKSKKRGSQRGFPDRFAARLRNGFRDAVDRDNQPPPPISNVNGVFETCEVLTENGANEQNRKSEIGATTFDLPQTIRSNGFH